MSSDFDGSCSMPSEENDSLLLCILQNHRSSFVSETRRSNTKPPTPNKTESHFSVPGIPKPEATFLTHYRSGQIIATLPQLVVYVDNSPKMALFQDLGFVESAQHEQADQGVTLKISGFSWSLCISRHLTFKGSRMGP